MPKLQEEKDSPLEMKKHQVENGISFWVSLAYLSTSVLLLGPRQSEMTSLSILVGWEWGKRRERTPFKRVFIKSRSLDQFEFICLEIKLSLILSESFKSPPASKKIKSRQRDDKENLKKTKEMWFHWVDWIKQTTFELNGPFVFFFTELIQLKVVRDLFRVQN